MAAGAAAPAQAKRAVEELQDAFEETSEKALPAVVNIRTTQEAKAQGNPHQFFFGDSEDLFDFFHGRKEGPDRGRSRRFRFEGVGSGVIISKDGLVLTNEHVVRDADQIEVTLTEEGGKKRTLPGKVMGTDRGLDLAVVKISAPGDFPHLKLGKAGKAKVGQWVLAIGSPFELEQTVTVGIVSAVRQSLLIEGRQYNNIIQTDAAINRGNSGGPLLNLDGEVLGINTAIYSPSGGSAGIGFAIPSEEIRTVLDDLQAGRKIRRGWIGIQVLAVDEGDAKRLGLPKAEGALVNVVFPGSPADKAGLKRGDVLVEFAGEDLDGPEDLIRLAGRMPPDKSVEAVYYRKGEKKSVGLKLADRPETPPEVPEPDEAPGAGNEGSPGALEAPPR